MTEINTLRDTFYYGCLLTGLGAIFILKHESLGCLLLGIMLGINLKESLIFYQMFKWGVNKE